MVQRNLLMFYVKRNKNILVQRKDELSRRFAVDIGLEHYEEGAWVDIQGEHENRMKSQIYIQNLCDGEVTKRLYCSRLLYRQLTEMSEIDYVEINYNVAITTDNRSDSDGDVEMILRGSEMNVMLAVSNLEHRMDELTGDIPMPEASQRERFKRTPQSIIPIDDNPDSSSDDDIYIIPDGNASSSPQQGAFSLVSPAAKRQLLEPPSRSSLISSTFISRVDVKYNPHQPPSTSDTVQTVSPMTHPTRSSPTITALQLDDNDDESSDSDYELVSREDVYRHTPPKTDWDETQTPKEIPKDQKATDVQVAKFYEIAEKKGVADGVIEKAIALCTKHTTEEQFLVKLSSANTSVSTFKNKNRVNIALGSIEGKVKSVSVYECDPDQNKISCHRLQDHPGHSTDTLYQNMKVPSKKQYQHAYSKPSTATVMDEVGTAVGLTDPVLTVDLTKTDDRIPGPEGAPSVTPRLLPAPHPTSVASSRRRRMIVLDGCNIAFQHGKSRFSAKGIELAILYFINTYEATRENIKAIVPINRNNPRDDPEGVLKRLESSGYLVFSPCKTIDGRTIVPYDDRFILDAAMRSDGVIVSNDKYEDLLLEKPEYRELIKNRVIMFMFFDDLFMPAEDSQGRHGPLLRELLNSGQASESVVKSKPFNAGISESSQSGISHHNHRKDNQRTSLETQELYKQLVDILPDQQTRIRDHLARNPYERDNNYFLDLCLN